MDFDYEGTACRAVCSREFVSGRRKSNGNERSKSEGTDEIYKSVNLTRPDGHEWENSFGGQDPLGFSGLLSVTASNEKTKK